MTEPITSILTLAAIAALITLVEHWRTRKPCQLCGQRRKALACGHDECGCPRCDCNQQDWRLF